MGHLWLSTWHIFGVCQVDNVLRRQRLGDLLRTPFGRSSQIFPHGSSDVSYAFVNSRHSASPADIRARNSTACRFVVSVLRRRPSSRASSRGCRAVPPASHTSRPPP